VCTYATQRIEVRGSGKAGSRWEPLMRASVYLDHPYATALEHTLNVDLFTDGEARSRHIALELSPESARELIDAVSRALAEAERA
jgi:RES domain-containing protein